MKRILISLALVIAAGNAVQANTQPDAGRWNTTGLKQANTMGGGEAHLKCPGAETPYPSRVEFFVDKLLKR